ncbi:phage Gp37/Gp68 family protein [Ensifer adhaerens]|uniref:DUF5131 family protein n=1 Tax=Ensifer adhaerens TaxID=106592 RepID=UPI001CBCB466|nr:phage Gp37/Gp68 family protein [Ensifer adhaerens]MBZ7921621.1 phage Gp37/Gp68 family protein [Ensifer adhaerens]UAX94040.1 phage Gp37/Gp68 family protein [Ensifer adhaerens]UAY01674.1 phage Gp37/Gp68 family protein [Ensifer adhaerens]UAY09058.1 phage Gp37/Gp68 family protein [Ensifer adhaerens]
MADGTKIEWTDATWNPITGCSVVSPGCTNCYAMKLAGTRLKHHPSREGLTRNSKAGPVWTGEVRFNPQWLDEPLRWKKPRMIFVCAHGDLFAEGVPDEWIDQIFAVMALAPQHTFQVLTKRPERMRDYLQEMARCFEHDSAEFSRRWGTAAAEVTGSPCAAGAIEDIPWPLPNVWLGTSAEDQDRYSSRWPYMEELQELGWLTWLSAEPLLGRILLRVTGLREVGPDARVHQSSLPQWVVAGGESGPNARPMHPYWPRQLRDQCADAGVPFHFKQWGAWGKPTKPRPSGTPGRFALAASPEGASEFWPAHVVEIGHWPRQIDLFGGATVLEHVGKKAAGRLLDGIEHNGFPGDPPMTPRSGSAHVKDFEAFVAETAPKLHWKIYQDLGADPSRSNGYYDGWQHGFGEASFGPLPLPQLIDEMKASVTAKVRALGDDRQ